MSGFLASDCIFAYRENKVPVWPSDQLILKSWSVSVPPGPTYFAVAVGKT